MDRLLVGVSGSAAVLSLPSYLATLRAALAKEVRVIMTAAAASILPPSTVALISDGVFLDENTQHYKTHP
jgi:hypothetical protein